MFIKCTSGPFRIGGRVLATGDTHEVPPEHVDSLRQFVASGLLSIHEKDPNPKALATKEPPKGATIEAEPPRKRKALRKSKSGVK